MAEERASPPEASEGQLSVGGIAEPPLRAGELRDRVPADIRAVSFPVSVRGYSRQAVDAYVERVNRVIAELEVSRSPRSAVRHALERVTEQVGGILEQAREAAEEITAGARREGEETTARAKADAADLVVQATAEADRARTEAAEVLAKARDEAEATRARSKAEGDAILARAREQAAEQRRHLEQELAELRGRAEAHLRELKADTGRLWEERGLRLEEIQGIAAGLTELVAKALARFPLPEPDGVDQEPSAEGTG